MARGSCYGNIKKKMGEICTDLELEVSGSPEDLLCGGRDANVSTVSPSILYTCMVGIRECGCLFGHISVVKCVLWGQSQRAVPGSRPHVQRCWLR